MNYKDPLDRTIKFDEDKVADVLWIALHYNYNKKTREYNIAVVGLTYPLQFHAHLYQICLPATNDGDSNVDPIGGLKYSIKLLAKEEENLKNYTNANGRTIYGECETKCTNETIPDFVTSNSTTETFETKL